MGRQQTHCGLRCAGAIPKDLGALGKLERLLLGHNELTGEVLPAELKYCYWIFETWLLERVFCTRSCRAHPQGARRSEKLE